MISSVSTFSTFYAVLSLKQLNQNWQLKFNSWRSYTNLNKGKILTMNDLFIKFQKTGEGNRVEQSEISKVQMKQILRQKMLMTYNSISPQG